jgi:hypothetical protein
MKVLIGVFLSLFCVIGYAQHVPFQRLGFAFTQTNITLIWDAPMNDLPRTLWSYTASPSSMSPTVISNLIVLGGFTAKDKRTDNNDPHVISYVDGQKYLLINTEWTFIDYRNPAVDDMNATGEVPDKEKGQKIATEWLSKLNIDRGQLVKLPHSGKPKIYDEAKVTYLYSRNDLKAPAYATNICARDYIFKRSLDGVEISGGSARGGCEIEIGHNSKIARLLLSWRRYEREKQYRTATSSTILEWIHEGKSVWYSPDLPYIGWSSIKKMTVTKLTPYYFSEGYGESDKPQNDAWPFVELEVKAETSNTNLTLNLDCPIIDEEKPMSP